MRKLNAGTAPACRLSQSRSSVKAGRILVAGSDPEERQELRIILEFEGHQVVAAETADQTLEQTCGGRHHLVITASRFEGIEPHTLCRRIRMKSNLGIIILAGDETTQNRIDAWNAGADDYLSSPFVYQELLARVRSVLRRAPRFDEEGPEIILEDRTVDLRSRQVKGPGSHMSRLTPKEFQVLQFLVDHANTAFTCRNLAQTAWREHGEGETENVRLVIRQLRRKLEPDPYNPRYLLAERSVGYCFRMPQPAPQNAAAELSSQMEGGADLGEEAKWEQPI